MKSPERVPGGGLQAPPKPAASAARARRRYRPEHKIRIVTATSLFDGHDAAINIMRRIMQASGAEVIHLGHNRSAAEIAAAAVQEDAQAVAVTSYQGGHMEFFRYLRKLLDDAGFSRTRIFGGGGGTILPEEIAELDREGTAKIYSPDDGRRLGLQGMIDDVLRRSDFAPGGVGGLSAREITSERPALIARAISAFENGDEEAAGLLAEIRAQAAAARVPVVGITGTGGSGKSSLIDEFVRRFLLDFRDKKIGIVSVDPTRRRGGGALLGDRIRMNAILSERVYMRSLATRGRDRALSPHVDDAVGVLKAAGFDLVLLESSGIGQSDSAIIEHCDLSVYVMTADYGAATQLEKIDMLDFADVVVLNKFDKRGAEDALRDVRKQYRRNREAFDGPDEALPVFGTVASRFNDPGTNRFYKALAGLLDARFGGFASTLELEVEDRSYRPVLPPKRARYLAEIAETARSYDRWVEEQVETARRLEAVETALAELDDAASEASRLRARRDELLKALDGGCRRLLESWDALEERYRGPETEYEVRGRRIRVETRTISLSGLSIPKIALPRYRSRADRLRWLLRENVPGAFPFTAGVFPFKRKGEDPTRMFAGEGGPERTNRRFHYLSYGMPAARLSTAFDSVTLYGEDPHERPDIYGKIGNAGVSICTLDDAKKLYSGFDLCDPKTSVSMTINGPAPAILAFFFNTAIDQACERWLREQGKADEVERAIEAKYRRLGLPRPRYDGELPAGNDGLGLLLLGATGDEFVPRETYERIKEDTVRIVRGTVQADILKEDQAQNTCIFSTEVALRMMGDIQQWFVEHGVRNFYSVSISGYHIAEAGANPITQLAFTLANGFTYVEYYLARGMKIDDFAPNLSFFFSNGLDPEYSVIGRVARRIWAKAMKLRYGASERSQKLKYHIQTSGRSLHAQEIAFNDIRTTLQALYAIYDNCNSLHTNAYDEAITTPTEESVRRALAIQLIINRELGLAKNENPLQGSFIIEELTDLVEEAVLAEFERLSERGGVLGAMESMYQRSKIQEESLLYERKKESGELPIIGVNTFLSPDGSPFVTPPEVRRSDDEEKRRQIANLRAFQRRNAERAPRALADFERAAVTGGNLFDALMEAVKTCSLGQLTEALYRVGGRYRRNM